MSAGQNPAYRNDCFLFFFVLPTVQEAPVGNTWINAMKDLSEYTTVIDDFQHRMEAKIRNHQTDQGFPDRGDLSEEELSDYLFDYQAALDSKGSERKRYTLAGILIILPVLVMSAFPIEQLPFEQEAWNCLLAVGIGFCLFLLYYLFSLLLVKVRIGKVNKTYPKAKRFIDQVKVF